jgi:hypothetical protein
MTLSVVLGAVVVLPLTAYGLAVLSGAHLVDWRRP